MNYKWHTRISLFNVTLLATILFISGLVPPGDLVFFWILGWFHTVYASPDMDHPNSRPTKNMKLVGKATSKTFKHRGMLHSVTFWTAAYLALGIYVYQTYNYSTWWFSGGLVAIYSHIFLDRISTKVKRTVTSISKFFHL